MIEIGALILVLVLLPYVKSILSAGSIVLWSLLWVVMAIGWPCLLLYFIINKTQF